MKGCCGLFFYIKVICVNKLMCENVLFGVIFEGVVEIVEDEGVVGDVDGGEFVCGVVVDFFVRGEVARGVDDDGIVVVGIGEEGVVG